MLQIEGKFTGGEYFCEHCQAGNYFISVEKGESGTYLIIHGSSRNFGNKLTCCK